MKLFKKLPADRAFNIIDTIVVEEAIRNAKEQGLVEKTRTAVLRAYKDETDNRGSHDSNGYVQFTEQTENGYVGIGMAPLG